MTDSVSHLDFESNAEVPAQRTIASIGAQLDSPATESYTDQAFRSMSSILSNNMIYLSTARGVCQNSSLPILERCRSLACSEEAVGIYSSLSEMEIHLLSNIQKLICRMDHEVIVKMVESLRNDVLDRSPIHIAAAMNFGSAAVFERQFHAA